MEKRLVSIAVLSSLIFGINTANAETPTGEIKVKGTIGIPTCIINAPDGGIYDLGRLSSTNIKTGTAVTVLPKITKTWTINCDSTTYVSYSNVDNRSASVSETGSDNNHYGLGYINGAGKIGFYRVLLGNAYVDGNSALVYFNYSEGGYIGGSDAKGYYLGTAFRYGWSDAASVATFGKNFSVDITVEPTLAGSTTMNGPVTEDANIDGSLTMNFSFGI